MRRPWRPLTRRSCWRAGRRDAATIVDSLISKSTGLMSLGRYLEAITLLRGALDLAEGRDLARVELRARNNLGTFLFDDDPPGSLALVRAGIDRAERIGAVGWAFGLTRIFSIGSFWCGQWDTVLAVTEAAEARDPPDDIHCSYETVRGWVFLGPRRRGTSATCDGGGSPLRAGSDEPDGHGVRQRAPVRMAGLLRGSLCRRAPPFDASRRAVLGDDRRQRAAGRPGCRPRAEREGRSTAAIELYARSGLIGRRVDAQADELEACVAALDGRMAEARQGFARAEEAYRRLGCVVERGLMAIERATLLEPRDESTEAAIDDAREIFTGLGAQALLDRLEAAASRSSGAQVPGRTGVAVVDRHAGVGQPLADEVGG